MTCKEREYLCVGLSGNVNRKLLSLLGDVLIFLKWARPDERELVEKERSPGDL